MTLEEVLKELHAKRASSIIRPGGVQLSKPLADRVIGLLEELGRLRGVCEIPAVGDDPGFRELEAHLQGVLDRYRALMERLQ